MNIPVLDLAPEIENLWDELQAAISGVLKSGQFIMGPNVYAFEDEVARYLGVKHAIGLNSGTDALFIALRVLGIGPGDEVITSPFTFFATAEAISHVGAIPVFVDVDPSTYTIDPTQIEAAITFRTRAIIPVHLYGQVTDMDPILVLAEKHGLKVIEDVAQAFGATYKGRRAGTIGELGAFSFFPTKNLGAYGDGGLVVTDDDSIAEVARMLRVHGSRKKYVNELVGYNSRLDEIQAAILRVKLKHVEEWNAGRLQAATAYDELLSGLKGIITPERTPFGSHVFHQYTVRISDGRRDEVQNGLAQAGVDTMVYYPTPVHRLPVYSAQRYRYLPAAELLAGQVLSLPIWPQIEPRTQEIVAGHLKRLLSAKP